MTIEQRIATYDDIDWHLLWQNARSEKSWKSKTAKDWSKKAVSFAERVKKTPYIVKFFDLLPVDTKTTILDVGCGPGTLAVPLAEKVRSVTAIDYSQGMISEVKKEARKRNIDNIKAVRCSWEDDWAESKIDVHDIAIASRSLNIDNLEEGIRKLDAHATRQVIITDRIAPSPFDPDVFAALNRTFNSGPDYIYTVNILYKMGIHPKIDHIDLPAETVYQDFDEALAAYKWMLKELTPPEESLLVDFLTSRITGKDRDGIRLKKRFPPKWAVISWYK